MLGGFSIDGSSVELCQPSCRLVAFVVLAGQPVPRQHAAFSLWPDANEEHARRSLRTALWAARQYDPSILAADESHVWPESPVLLDLRTAAADAGDMPSWTTAELRTAIDRFVLPLLPGWYDDWIELPRQRWDRERLHALDCLSGELLRRRAFGAAEEAATAAVAIEPLRETSRLALIRALVEEGNVAEALYVRRSFNEVLARELGVVSSSLVDGFLAGVVSEPSGVRPFRSAVDQRVAVA